MPERDLLSREQLQQRREQHVGAGGDHDRGPPGRATTARHRDKRGEARAIPFINHSAVEEVASDGVEAVAADSVCHHQQRDHDETACMHSEIRE
jgi:hypothetical protein